MATDRDFGKRYSDVAAAQDDALQGGAIVLAFASYSMAVPGSPPLSQILSHLK